MKHGFTLIEIIIVAGLAMVLVLTGTLFATDQTIADHELDRAFASVRSELATAQRDAQIGVDDSSWGVALISPQRIVRFRGASYPSRAAAFDTITNFNMSVIITGPAEIVFTLPEGVPTSAADFSITNGRRTHTVSVNTAGAISVQ